MLILPLHKKPSRENFPLATLILLIINVAVFALLQSGDHRVEQQAAQRYVDSGVLSMEWAWFDDWSQTRPQRAQELEHIDQWLGPVGENDHADQMRLMIIESEQGFTEAVERGLFVETASSEFQRWQSAREQLDADRDASFTRRYLLRYDEINPVTAFTHMFMHGGLGHLIGNMLFLVALGLLVEGALGSARFLLLYLLSGLGAVVASLAMHWGADTGGLGASGAIAGLMGLYAVVYGMRRVRFFYWLFVYFDYVRAPALILLPMWLGWELLAFVISDGSNIAYEAHIGGIVAGALLGLMAVRLDQVNHGFLDEDERRDNDREAVTLAQQAMQQLNGPSAKRHLRPLLERHAGDTQLLRLYFAACRLRADDPEIHNAARRILQLPGDSPEQRALIIETFAQYRAACGTRLKLSLDLATELAGRLASWGEVESARFLLDRLVRGKRFSPLLPQACRALSDRLRHMDNKPQEADHYQQLAGKTLRAIKQQRN